MKMQKLLHHLQVTVGTARYSSFNFNYYFR